jgi:thiamine-phosphate pyrophosphorylase
MNKIGGLYAIADADLIGLERVVESAKLALDGGASVLQLRSKSAGEKILLEKAHELRELTGRYEVPFIINDRVDLVTVVEADGVHLGSQDLPVEQARGLLGPAYIIGSTVHSLEESGDALLVSDYIGVGPVYRSPTKPELNPSGLDLLHKMRQATTKSIIAIGGITVDKIPEIKATGCDGFAAVSMLFNTDSVRNAAEACVQRWNA